MLILTLRGSIGVLQLPTAKEVNLSQKVPKIIIQFVN